MSQTNIVSNNRAIAVVVIFEKSPSTVNFLSLLLSWLNAPSTGSFQLEHILIYDNSRLPSLAFSAMSGSGITYVHNATNGGTAAAYSHAVEIAKKLKAAWLLLLDQDTDLPTGYLSSAYYAACNDTCLSMAAFVPIVKHADRVISPARISRFGSIKAFVPSLPSRGGTGGPITAISSGAILNVHALSTILPFPKELWLDYVDHWTFMALGQHGFHVGFIDEILAHDLSLESPRTLTVQRLRSILKGEAVFQALLGRFAKLVYPGRLLLRLVRYSVRSPHLAYEMLRWISKN